MRYGGAVVAVALATALRLLLNSTLGTRLPLTTYFVAVILVASFAGLGPALLSIALSAAIGKYLFVAQVNSFVFADRSGLLQVGAFSVLTISLSILIKVIQDARRRAEQNASALAASREQLATILASISDAVIATDIDGCVTFINGVAQSLTGCNSSDASGKPVQDLFRILDETTHTPVEDVVQRVLENGARVSHRGVLIGKTGIETPIEDSSSPIKDENGASVGALLVFRDITQRKLAEQALGESEARFRTMANTAPVMMWLSDSEGQRTFFNQQWLDFTGRTLEQEVGLGWIDSVHPDDLQRLLDRYTSSLKARESFSIEYRLKRFDDEYRWVLVTSAPRWTDDGEFIGLAGSVIDITDSKSAAEASYFLASIVESSEDAIIGKTLNGVILSWNAAAERIYGYSSDEVKGQNIDILVPPDRKEELARMYQVLKGGEPIPHLETTRIRKDGVLIDVALTLSPMRDESGHLTGVSAIERDITDRKRVEQEREALAAQIESERLRQNNLVANVPGVVWEVWGQPDESEQRIDFVSDHVEKMLGYSVDQWLSTPNFWLTIVHPDDKERAAQEAAAIFASRKGGISRFRWLASDGRVVWVEAQSVVVCDDHETPIGMRGVTMDITERKRAEDSQRFLAEASGLLATSLDYETTLASVAKLAVPMLADWCTVYILEESTGALRQVAIAHSDPAKVRTAQELSIRFPPDPDSPIGVPNVMRTGRPEFYPHIDQERLELAAKSSEFAEILRKEGLRSGMIVPLVARNRTLGTITLLTAESGRVYDRIDLALAEDLAHRIALAVDNARLYREAQAALIAREDALALRDELLEREHAARQEAETANRAKDEFLATVSHELRTPLNAILGWAHMLRANRLDEITQSRALETIERNAKSQAQLIEDILDVSRIVTGKLRLDVRPVELAPVVEAAIDSVRPAADAKDIRIEAILDPRAGPVSGDANRLQQIVWNLVSNAVKFTSKGGRVQVRIERVNSRVEIIVSDSGQGITSDFIPYVFDRFRQADATSTRRYGGLGLGLAIVRHLTEMHGGIVTAASSGEGLGATFTVKLPVIAAHVDELASERVHPTSGGSVSSLPPPNLDGVKVLVVDDEPDTREMLRVMVGQFGALVKACSSSFEALNVLKDWEPDVIVSDIEMPDEDGYELIRKVRRAEASTGARLVPAVALTAYARVEDRMRALSAGYQMHIAKPAEPAELAIVIASLAGGVGRGTSS